MRNQLGFIGIRDEVTMEEPYDKYLNREVTFSEGGSLVLGVVAKVEGDNVYLSPYIITTSNGERELINNPTAHIMVSNPRGVCAMPDGTLAKIVEASKKKEQAADYQI